MDYEDRLLFPLFPSSITIEACIFHCNFGALAFFSYLLPSSTPVPVISRVCVGVAQELVLVHSGAIEDGCHAHAFLGISFPRNYKLHCHEPFDHVIDVINDEQEVTKLIVTSKHATVAS